MINMLIENFKRFIKLNDDQKLVLLKSLGYDVNSNGFIIDSKTGNKILCKYTEKPVLFKDASILPGSTVIVNTSLITLSEYIFDYLEPEED